MKQILQIANHTRRRIWSSRPVRLLAFLLGISIIYAGCTSLLNYRTAEASRKQYQQTVRSNWVNSPDKHPHRMAHYGYLAFRPKSPLSVFDHGLESYTGNAVFLEAHRQNSTNFSEASLSTAMLRFGDISIAMVLQMLLPLFIFFIGFNCISADRENGTLKLLLTQNLSPGQLLIGNILGVSGVAFYILMPAFLLAAALQLLTAGSDPLLLALNFLLYTSSVFIYAGIAVLASAVCRESRMSLVMLIGIWLLFVLALPRLSQAVATNIYPAPGKAAFESAIEKDILQQGDSHNPDDPYYKKLKDSVLKANNATTVQDLSFNYSGFQMKMGEQASAVAYQKHLDRLLLIYKNQIETQNALAFINPYTGLRQLSMALCQTDFDTYTHFQRQAEQYRYELAQQMNDLQIQLIPNKKLADTAKNYSIGHQHWEAFKDFTYRPLTTRHILTQQTRYFAAMLFWLLLVALLVGYCSRNLKAI
jgi:ABC-2 type transport system permease protein